MCMCCMWHPTAELRQTEDQPEGFVFAVAGVTLQERQAGAACGCLKSTRVSLMARMTLTNCILSMQVTNSLHTMKTDQALFLL